MASFRLWTIQNSPRAAARERAFKIPLGSCRLFRMHQDPLGVHGILSDCSRFLRIPQAYSGFLGFLSSSSGFIRILCGSSRHFRIMLLSICKVQQDSSGLRRVLPDCSSFPRVLLDSSRGPSPPLPPIANLLTAERGQEEDCSRYESAPESFPSTARRFQAAPSCTYTCTQATVTCK